MLTSPRDLLRGYVEISSLPKIHARLDEAKPSAPRRPVERPSDWMAFFLASFDTSFT